MTRFQFVADHRDAFEVKRLCQLVEIERSSYYAWEQAQTGREARASSDAALAATIRELGEPVSMVVSSDMSHYLPEAAAKKRDSMALSRALALDPTGLLDVVRREDISMCGVLPMTLGLLIARALGATSARLAAYATSGEVSGDYNQVVGYAGVLVE